MPLEVRDDAADSRLERATDFANRALDREPAEAPEREPREEPKAPPQRFDPSETIDKITHPAHERFLGSRRDREISRRMEEMERKLLERVDALVPKPPKPEEPDFQRDPVAWQEWHDQQFREGIVEDIVQRIQPPADLERERATAAQREAMDEVGGWMREYVETTYREQGYSDPGTAWEAMDARAKAYQQIRTHEIMQERGVDYQTAAAWKDREVAEAARWAASQGRQPIAYLDGLAMRKIAQYAGAGQGGVVDDDAEERKRASSSSMAGGIGGTSAPRSGSDKPLTRMSLKDVPKDRKAYRELIQKNRQPGETLEAANRRIRTQLLKAR